LLKIQFPVNALNNRKLLAYIEIKYQRKCHQNNKQAMTPAQERTYRFKLAKFAR